RTVHRHPRSVRADHKKSEFQASAVADRQPQDHSGSPSPSSSAPPMSPLARVFQRYREDLQHGQKIDGLTIQNPFASL
ncbi:MAG TPA: hypothetical protein VGM07_01405, partial [Stellaceae bacterium]